MVDGGTFREVHTNVSKFQGENVSWVVREATITLAEKEFTTGSDAVPQGEVRKLNVFS